MKRGILLFTILFIACAKTQNPKLAILKIKGSDTMLQLTRLWAEVYMKENPGISVYTEGGGTATGAFALATGQVDICAASRPLRSEEISLIAENYNTVGIAIRVGKDALSVYLNPENPVNNLTITELQKIFNGQIQNWAQVGGKDASIIIYTRNPNSGTHFYFKEHILEGKNYRLDAITLSTTAQVVDKVAQNVDAIGYGGMAFTTGIKRSRINGIEPSLENVLNESYPIIRYLYLYTVNTPRGNTKNFIDWVLTKERQNLIKQAGFYPLWMKETG
ncbi:phosphate ABC transporter substrate-binding protein [candidate division KSB1 bacterium]|nr:phosphate ABC transporter substrate-binding protein [candidate division KSB1 bacterium]